MIIQSLLDTDLYKLTMGQVVLHQFPGSIVEYTFKCRTKGIDLVPYVDEIQKEIDNLCNLKVSKEELEYLKSLGYFKDTYLEFLGLLQLKSSDVVIDIKKDFELKILGPWMTTIYFETPLLAIINEVYFKNQSYEKNKLWKEGEKRLKQKIELIKHVPELGFKLVDFGSRRRFSREWHDNLINLLKKSLPSNNLLGTSNVYFAKKYKLRPIGTMAHEFIQAAQALGPRLVDSQKYAFQAWANEYRGSLGIALSDTLGMDAFFRDFDAYFAKLYDGCRHDSGDPYEWCDKLLNHYETLGIDARTKTAVFSDGLDIPRAIDILRTYHKKINISFGIGTNLTNDLGPKPIQIVIKMTNCDGFPVAKISDSPGKQMCKDEQYLEYLRKIFKIPPRKEKKG
ncbi:MAG: nicotinate phosphoribosyltransferase [Promethearchaeota archaeon]